MVAEELEGVAALDKALALVDQALELDRLDLRAVLLGLGAALRLLVAVELGLDAVDLAVEEIDERPQEIGEIVLKPRAGQHHLERLDRGFELQAGGVGLWQWPGIRFVLARTMTVERQLGEEMRRRRGGVAFGVRIIGVEEGEGAAVMRHGGCLSAGGSAAPVAAFTAIQRPGTERGRTRRAAAQRRVAGAEHFASRCKAGLARRRKMVGARHCEPVAAPADRRSGRPGRGPFSAGQGTRRHDRRQLLLIPGRDSAALHPNPCRSSARAKRATSSGAS